jgi:hypothetical protein
MDPKYRYTHLDEIKYDSPKDYVPITFIYYNPDLYGFLYGDNYSIKELYKLIKKYTSDYNTYRLIKAKRSKKSHFLFDFDINVIDAEVVNILSNKDMNDVDRMFYCGDVEGKYKEGYMVHMYAKKRLNLLSKGLSEFSCVVPKIKEKNFCVIEKDPSIQKISKQ